MTPDEIISVIGRKREMHPELDGPVGWNGLQRILTRENIGLFIRPLPRPAQLVQWRGAWSILLDAAHPPRRHLYYATHELGHLWLHHDSTAERWERIYNMDHWESDDRRESDAELFCTIVLGQFRYF